MDSLLLLSDTDSGRPSLGPRGASSPPLQRRQPPPDLVPPRAAPRETIQPPPRPPKGEHLQQQHKHQDKQLTNKRRKWNEGPFGKKFHYLIIAILIGFHFLSERSKLSNFKFISDFQINFCIRWWRQWLLCCCCVAPLLAVRLLRLFCFAVTYLLGTTECNNHHHVASSTFAK